MPRYPNKPDHGHRVAIAGKGIARVTAWIAANPARRELAAPLK